MGQTLNPISWQGLLKSQLSQCGFPSFPSQNEKELQEVIQQQNEKILEQIDKSGELIVCSV